MSAQRAFEAWWGSWQEDAVGRVSKRDVAEIAWCAGYKHARSRDAFEDRKDDGCWVVHALITVGIILAVMGALSFVVCGLAGF